MLVLGCEVSAGDVVIVFLSVINGSFTLGNALPKLEAFATALGSATLVFEIIDRVVYSIVMHVHYNLATIIILETTN